MHKLLKDSIVCNLHGRGQMQVSNNKVGLIIGKGGETIKNLQGRFEAHIQLIPLHLPKGETVTSRTL